jgi:hypothetical protein
MADVLVAVEYLDDAAKARVAAIEKEREEKKKAKVDTIKALRKRVAELEMGQLDPALVKRAAGMLRAYSEVLTNHGCNDYPVADTEEGRALDALVNKWYGDEDAQTTHPSTDAGFRDRQGECRLCQGLALPRLH